MNFKHAVREMNFRSQGSKAILAKKKIVMHGRRTDRRTDRWTGRRDSRNRDVDFSLFSLEKNAKDQRKGNSYKE